MNRLRLWPLGDHHRPHEGVKHHVPGVVDDRDLEQLVDQFTIEPQARRLGVEVERARHRRRAGPQKPLQEVPTLRLGIRQLVDRTLRLEILDSGPTHAGVDPFARGLAAQHCGSATRALDHRLALAAAGERRQLRIGTRAGRGKGDAAHRIEQVDVGTASMAPNA